MVPNRKHFDEDLRNLNLKVANMGQEVIKSYEKLIEACKNKDNAIASDIIETDKYINEIEIAINVDAYLVIAKQCPVASDLRRIITALKISNDLERIADYTVNIAKYLIKTKNDNEFFLKSIIELTNHVIKMLKDIMIAFENEDITLALQVDESDDILDEMYNKDIKQMMNIGTKKTDEEAEEAIRTVLVLKQIERAGDHITNIAENIVYLVNGKRVELN
jgi:phosphate transport system protein